MADQRVRDAAERLCQFSADKSLLRSTESLAELQTILVDCRRWAALGQACELCSSGGLTALLDLLAAQGLPVDLRLKMAQTLANAMASSPQLYSFFEARLEYPALMQLVAHNPGKKLLSRWRDGQARIHHPK